jgi:hypothetical protein
MRVLKLSSSLYELEFDRKYAFVPNTDICICFRNFNLQFEVLGYSMQLKMA